MLKSRIYGLITDLNHKITCRVSFYHNVSTKYLTD